MPYKFQLEQESPIGITARVPFSPDNAFKTPKLSLKLLGITKVLGGFGGVEAE